MFSTVKSTHGIIAVSKLSSLHQLINVFHFALCPRFYNDNDNDKGGETLLTKVAERHCNQNAQAIAAASWYFQIWGLQFQQ